MLIWPVICKQLTSCPSCIFALTKQNAFCLGFSQNGLKYPQQGLGQLLLQVVLCVNGNVVLQHIDGVLKKHRGQKGKAHPLQNMFRETNEEKTTLHTSDFMYAATPFVALMMT